MDMQQIKQLRDTIDGELNRVAVIEDKTEILKMYEYLQNNIYKYCVANIDKLESKLKTEYIRGGNLKP